MPALHKKVLERNLNASWKIFKGDLVEITTGKDKGKRGVIKKVLRDSNRVVVDGCNLVKKNIRRTEERAGYSIMKESPIHCSNVALICPETDKRTKVGWRFLEDGSKVRMAKESGAVIPKPEPKKRLKRPSNPFKDTDSAEVIKVTWTKEEREQLINYYLIKLEQQEVDRLQRRSEKEEQKQMQKELNDKLFNMRVLKRAKEILAEQQQQQGSLSTFNMSEVEEKTKNTTL
ncbi:hypothetical protein FDP41_011275 [Naegleria fowleri]|uniref:KOW domain-containing protein n=1 Tax=Naegleria fowleri TaxID=5763 RepID=A0A6A5CAE2_NAEFO|nr:uncharacterized protein FDP41_011275 [Naegleria fowleri]KAF0982345.1 hypothetical protein FDP41_011275 [Naegleria fowleri]CAG4708326.1 unnamed protein product [Naegleria fowleri]